MLDPHDGLPAQSRGITNHMNLRVLGAVVDDIEPVVLLEPFSGFVLVGRQRPLRANMSETLLFLRLV